MHDTATITTTSLLPLNYAKRQTKQATIYVYINHENAFSTQFNKRDALCYCAYMVDVLVSVCATAKCVCVMSVAPHIFTVTTIAVAVAVVISIVVVASVSLLRNCTLIQLSIAMRLCCLDCAIVQPLSPTSIVCYELYQNQTRIRTHIYQPCWVL